MLQVSDKGHQLRPKCCQALTGGGGRDRWQKGRRKGSGGLANENASSTIVEAVETDVRCRACESKHRSTGPGAAECEIQVRNRSWECWSSRDSAINKSCDKSQLERRSRGTRFLIQLLFTRRRLCTLCISIRLR